MKYRKLWPYVLLLVPCTAGDSAAGEWPVWQDSTYKPIGNGYGQLQDYSESIPFMHTGIDIMVPWGTPVYAVKSGYVKAVMTTGAETHWRVVIGDSAGTAWCDAYMYAHLHPISIAVSSGEWVEEGQYLGDVTWFAYQEDFDHLHLSIIRYGGTIADWEGNFPDWQYSGNPLDDIDVINDPDAPVFDDAIGAQKFVFRVNQSATYFAEGAVLSGDVDIICRVYDYMSDYAHKINPHGIEYRIGNDPGAEWINGFCFTDRVGSYTENYDLVGLVYVNDLVCDSKGDYDERDYFFAVTNTNGDSLIEETDQAYAWRTGTFNNGEYVVYVKAYDRTGNTTIDSMSVLVENFFDLTGTVAVDEHSPDSSGTIVTITAGSQTDTTDLSGHFSIPGVGGGSQAITVSRRGHATLDTVIMMDDHKHLDLALQRLFIIGDANSDEAVNVGDAVYIINFVFKNGPEPVPYDAGDANADAAVNVGDAVYLINFIFKNGPPPKEI